MKAIEILKIIYKDCKEWEDKGFAVTYPTNDLNEAIKELEELKNRSCENCCESKTCKILHSVYKDKLKKEGYAMQKNEFKCGFWHSLF